MLEESKTLRFIVSVFVFSNILERKTQLWTQIQIKASGWNQSFYLLRCAHKLCWTDWSHFSKLLWLSLFQKSLVLFLRYLWSVMSVECIFKRNSISKDMAAVCLCFRWLNPNSISQLFVFASHVILNVNKKFPFSLLCKYLTKC